MKQNQKHAVLCSNCRKLINIDEPSCPYCGIYQPGSKWNIHRLSQLFKQPDLLIKALMYTNIGMFALTLLIPPKFSLFEHGIWMLLTPSAENLIKWGATGTYMTFGSHGYFSFISAYFLHGSLLHIIFNMMALKGIGPWVIKEFGGHRMFIIYSVSGFIGFLISYLVGIKLTIGASGALYGLMGAGIFFGFNRGGAYGQMILRQFGGWAIGLILLGVFMNMFNNWAHGGGLLAGFLTAMVVGYEERGRELKSHKLVSYAFALITLFTLMRAVVLGFYYFLST